MMMWHRSAKPARGAMWQRVIRYSNRLSPAAWPMLGALAGSADCTATLGVAGLSETAPPGT
jgi:hypothetical protein